MPSYEHKKLIERIGKLDELPSDPKEYAEWIKAEAHLALLRDNGRSNEIVVQANGEYTFVDSIVVPNDVLSRLTTADLEQWQFDSYSSIAGSSMVAAERMYGSSAASGAVTTGTRTEYSLSSAAHSRDGRAQDVTMSK